MGSFNRYGFRVSYLLDDCDLFEHGRTRVLRDVCAKPTASRWNGIKFPSFFGKTDLSYLIDIKEYLAVSMDDISALFRISQELGSVSRACQLMGVSRDTFYRHQELADQGGVGP